MRVRGIVRAAALIAAMAAGTLGSYVAHGAPLLDLIHAEKLFACVCSMCNREPLSICTCAQAQKMKVRLGVILLDAGGDTERITAAMKNAYGDTVTQPNFPSESETTIPWLGPIVFGLFGVGLALQVRSIQKRRKHAR